MNFTVIETDQEHEDDKTISQVELLHDPYVLLFCQLKTVKNQNQQKQSIKASLEKIYRRMNKSLHLKFYS